MSVQTGDNSTATGSGPASGAPDHDAGPDDQDLGPDDLDGDDEEDELDPVALQAKIKQLEKDNARYRRERRAGKNSSAPATPAKGAEGDVTAQIAAATAQARSDARAEYSEQLAGTRIQSALEGLNIPDADSLVEDMNLSKFVDEDGNVDTDAVKALIDRYRPLARRRRKPGHGNQGGTGNTSTDEQQERAAARKLFSSGQK